MRRQLIKNEPVSGCVSYTHYVWKEKKKPPTVPFKSKLTVRCESRFSTRFTILESCVNRESSRKSSLTGQKTKDSPMTDFSTYSCNTTRHGYIRKSNCMLETRPIQVITQMFL